MPSAIAGCKAIILGEHAVVPPFKKYGIAAAAGPDSTYVTVHRGLDKVRVNSGKYGRAEMDITEIHELCYCYESLRSESAGYRQVRELAATRPLDPLFAIAGEIFKRYGWRPLEIKIGSSVPKNLGSSASVFVATAAAILETYGADFDSRKIADIANRGDMITHGRASGIDAHTIAAGGWNSYRAGEGVKQLDVDFPVHMVAIDSGEPSRTMDTVDYFHALAMSKPDEMIALADELERFVNVGLGALRNNDMDTLGYAMTSYYHELRKVDNIEAGIPKVGFLTPTMKKIVETALGCDGVLGAKPTGGWGGGCVLALARDEETASRLKSLLSNYKAYDLQLGAPGVRVFG